MVLQQVQWEHVVCEEWVQCLLGGGVWPGCHVPCSKLAMLETIWVMVTDSTVDSGGTSVCLPHQIPHSPSHRLLAEGLSQHWCRQVRDDHLAGKDRHNYCHEM